MSYEVVRSIGADGVWAPTTPRTPTSATPGFKIVRLGSGPSGAAAGQDIAIGFSGGYLSGEIIPGPMVKHKTTVTSAHSGFCSRDKPNATVSFTLYRNTVFIGTAVMDPLTCGPGPIFYGVVTLTGGSVTFEENDLPDMGAPVTVDPSFNSGEVTLAGP